MFTGLQSTRFLNRLQIHPSPSSLDAWRHPTLLPRFWQIQKHQCSRAPYYANHGTHTQVGSTGIFGLSGVHLSKTQILLLSTWQRQVRVNAYPAVSYVGSVQVSRVSSHFLYLLYYYIIIVLFSLKSMDSVDTVDRLRCFLKNMCVFSVRFHFLSWTLWTLSCFRR